MNILPKFVLNQLSTYVAVIVIFVNNNVLDKSLECACNKQGQFTECSLYMALPFLILFALKLRLDKTFQKVWKYVCTCECCCCEGYRNEFCSRFCRFPYMILYHVMKAASIGSLWVVSLLIEGDWYVCCYNDQAEKHPQLACKDRSSITPEEREIIARLTNTSRVIGFSVLLSITVVAAFLSCGWRRYCRRKGKRRVIYNRLILEEEGKVLAEILRNAANKKLTEEVTDKINGEEWEECFDVAADLIKSCTKPALGQRGGEGGGGRGGEGGGERGGEGGGEEEEPRQQQRGERAEEQKETGIPLHDLQPERQHLMQEKPETSTEDVHIL